MASTTVCIWVARSASGWSLRKVARPSPVSVVVVFCLVFRFSARRSASGGDESAGDAVGQGCGADAVADTGQAVAGDVVDEVVGQAAAGGVLAVGQGVDHGGELLDQGALLGDQRGGGAGADAQHAGDLVGHPVIDPGLLAVVVGARRAMRGAPAARQQGG
jgi:hypothetical protein